MPDDPKKQGHQDDSKVSLQPHELAYVAKKFGVTVADVRAAIESVGNSRKAVEAYLKEM